MGIDEIDLTFGAKLPPIGGERMEKMSDAHRAHALREKKQIEAAGATTGSVAMDYERAKESCHIRSAIYRESKKVKYWKNHSVPLDERVPEEDKKAADWKEYDPRAWDETSLFMFND